MFRKKLSHVAHYSIYNKLLRRKVADVTAVVPDTDDSFKINDYAELIGKNIEEIISNIDNFDELNHYNKIYAESDSINVPEKIYLIMEIEKKSYIITCVVRSISTHPFNCKKESMYQIIYETMEIYGVPCELKKYLTNVNYYDIREFFVLIFNRRTHAVF